MFVRHLSTLLSLILLSRFATVLCDVAINTRNTYFEESSQFVWGVATAAYQIEGATAEDGKSPNIWDTFASIPGKIHAGDTADIADDSYHKFSVDVELLKAMGIKSYRFSIAWSRIFPSKSREVNQLGLDYYNKLIDMLIEAKIEPLVTLYHWDLPQYLQDEYGGWLSTNIKQDFLLYADICFLTFGDRVKLWATMNEPWSFAYLGYGVGTFAPGRCSNRAMCNEGDSATEPYIVGHNVLNTHSAIVDLYRRKYQSTQDGKIGIVLNLDWAEPFTSDEENVNAAERRREFALGWFADPIFFGKYPPSMIKAVGDRLQSFTEEEQKLLIGSVDFFALNHYTTKYIKNSVNSGQGWAEDQQNEETAYDVNGNLIGPQGQSIWLNIVPWGVRKLLLWVTERYTINGVKPVIVITENGFDVYNETSIPLPDVLHDTPRISYYSQYFDAITQAVSEGVLLRGYYAWSLLDNFEWADGYSCRFGMHYVDYTDPNRQRYAKDSSKWYSNFAIQHPKGFDYTYDSFQYPNGIGVIPNQFTWKELFNRVLSALGRLRVFPAMRKFPCTIQ